MERHVFKLLHRAGSEAALAAVLMPVVHGALAGDDPKTVRLKKAILDIDFTRTADNAEIAARLGISRRQLQRRRAKAVSAIARYAHAMGTPDARERVDARFESELTAYRKARDAADTFAMRSIAANLARIAQTPKARSAAGVAMAEANVHGGHEDVAAGLLGGLPPAASLAVHAKLALLEGEFDRALGYLQAAAGRGSGDDGFRASLLAAKIGRLRGLAAMPYAVTAGFAAESWEAAAMEVERAEYELYLGRLQSAARLAVAAFRRAGAGGFNGLAARAAAIAHDAGARAGERWRSTAVALLLRSGDPLLATGLFRAPPVHGREPDPLLIATVYDRLCVIVPQIFADSAPARAAVGALLAALLARAAAFADASKRLDAGLAAVRRTDSALAHYAAKCEPALREMFVLTSMALHGLCRRDALRSVEGVVSESVARLRPAAQRAIPILVPRRPPSQIGPAGHLIVDDDGAVGAAGGQEYAGLRFRIVSVRSDACRADARHGEPAVARTARAAANAAHPRQW